MNKKRQNENLIKCNIGKRSWIELHKKHYFSFVKKIFFFALFSFSTFMFIKDMGFAGLYIKKKASLRKTSFFEWKRKRKREKGAFAEKMNIVENIK